MLTKKKKIKIFYFFFSRIKLLPSVQSRPMEDLGSMFDDLSFDTLASTPTAAVAKEPSREKKASLPQMTTLRGVSASFDLDALISDEEKRRHKWKNMFKVGETGIEALYTEDGQYYAARIDEVLEQPQMYQVGIFSAFLSFLSFFFRLFFFS
jgi:hypothetical protein